MKITIEMPEVQNCTVGECAYNSHDTCHAKAITIGDGMHPGCDTFLDGGAGHTRLDGMAGVGACKVTGCHHNADFECMAERIEVSISGGKAHCMTFSTA